jgi:hypothetical protein
VFGKLSRYRAVPDVAVPDADGRVVTAKDTRPLPVVTGTYRHTVDAGDRLDQLANTYYGEPTRYWRICDANPDILSPLALLGDEPVVTTTFPVTIAGVPPWATVLAALADAIGVEGVAVVEDVALEPVRQTIDGTQVVVVVERFTRALVVTRNRVTSTAAQLAAVIAAAGFAVGPPVDTGRVGKPITIPVAVSG